MSNRRDFIQTLALGSAAVTLGACQASEEKPENILDGPIAISTWNNRGANSAAMLALTTGKTVLDAVEAGARVPEGDPNDRSVGYGGRPDRDGHVTLDACIMNSEGDCGSVTFLEGIKHPVSVARLVMEKTPHVMLSGAGALQLAKANGFEEEDLLTEDSKKEWEAWKIKEEYSPVINIENHDTIGILARDNEGNLSGACTTSGAAYKMRGRVGDSPLIGAGLFVDNEVGAATATGLGEAVIRVCGTHLVVEMMRQGHSPQEACKLAVERVVQKNPDYQSLQVGFIAINKAGEYGGFCIQPGFEFIVSTKSGTELIKSKSYIT
ncbi:MAG: N(4)-(beta-N-acetylglucosaminyl)-L-asparaginase [Bacteroidia bacterium]|nr:N(4)-(beta-N-acetylglucosaminyl)-L-asparaginase [Bacteroidia bacterium]